MSERESTGGRTVTVRASTLASVLEAARTVMLDGHPDDDCSVMALVRRDVEELEAALPLETAQEATGGFVRPSEGWDESTATTERQRLMLEGTPFEVRVDW